jgi:hypothetical protein
VRTQELAHSEPKKLAKTRGEELREPVLIVSPLAGFETITYGRFSSDH